MAQTTKKEVDKNIEKENEVKVAMPKIALSIVVLENGSILVTKNEKPVTNVQKVEFYADGNNAPRLTITEAIVPKK